jgi:hypothetical protein
MKNYLSMVFWALFLLAVPRSQATEVRIEPTDIEVAADDQSILVTALMNQHQGYRERGFGSDDFLGKAIVAIPTADCGEIEIPANMLRPGSWVGSVAQYLPTESHVFWKGVVYTIKEGRYLRLTITSKLENLPQHDVFQCHVDPDGEPQKNAGRVARFRCYIIVTAASK